MELLIKNVHKIKKHHTGFDKSEESNQEMIKLYMKLINSVNSNYITTVKSIKQYGDTHFQADADKLKNFQFDCLKKNDTGKHTKNFTALSHYQANLIDIKTAIFTAITEYGIKDPTITALIVQLNELEKTILAIIKNIKGSNIPVESKFDKNQIIKQRMDYFTEQEQFKTCQNEAMTYIIIKQEATLLYNLVQKLLELKPYLLKPV